MLPKNKRIRKESFEKILHAGRVFNGLHFSLRSVAAARTGFAVTVSKKVAAHAVDRNRTRRRAYATIGSLLPGVVKTTFSILAAKPGAAALSFQAQQEEITNLFKKAGLI